MVVCGVLILLISLLIVPVLIGTVMPSEDRSLLKTFVIGYLIEWCLFYPVAVSLILTERKFSLLSEIYTGLLGVMVLLGILLWMYRKKHGISRARNERKLLKRNEIVYLGVFVALLLFQLYKTLFYAYADGDDAFYVATAQNAVTSDTMYILDPYTGISNSIDDLNFRYALAPFPMWLAYLSKISGINVAIVAHLFVPVALVCITYAIYSFIAKMLFKNSREKQLLFMDMVAVLVLFSNVSTSTAETFLLTRARQGKEVLANIVLPMLFLLLMEIYSELKENDTKIKNTKIVLGMVNSTCAALMSVFGGVLFIIALLAFGLIILFEKKKIRVLADVAIMAIPAMISVLIYMIMG